ncbi:CPBP family intramembrane glutamic endopeptidase [Actinoplanes sp. DH11]|uniref:CPBP family intramembrane glutamic endopeptidase n=1 Tax=Actinoplanes sp. DH11 TaxID=2857011 RepID=UPI001E47F271|nr:CPBP family intramembrane glutamic endopeptidase [Actinoplanes sp. DH11]
MSIAVSVMVAVRVWTWIGPPRAHPVTGPAAAVLLVVLSGLPAASVGLTLTGWVYALSGVALIAAGYGAGLLLPYARRALAEPSFPAPWRTALVEIPLATVVFEEVAFRGVLWALISAAHGPAWATAGTAVLFGLWHISPDPGVRRQVGAVAFTTLAGLVLGLLRDLSGGLLAPFALHWAANGLGVLASTVVRRRASGPATGDSSGS